MQGIRKLLIILLHTTFVAIHLLDVSIRDSDPSVNVRPLMQVGVNSLKPPLLKSPKNIKTICIKNASANRIMELEKHLNKTV